MKRKSYSACALTVVVVMMLAGCGASGGQAGSVKKELTPIALGTIPGTLYSLPAYVGIAEGIFKKYGLDAEAVAVQSGPAMIAALTSGSIDEGGLAPGLAMIAGHKGQAIKLIAEKMPIAPYTWLAQLDYPTPHAKDGYPKSALDLKGATVGVTVRGAETEQFTKVFAKDAGLDPETDITFVAVGSGASALAAFKAKQIDVLVGFEPSQTILMQGEHLAKSLIDLRKGEASKLFQNWSAHAQVALESKLKANPKLFKAYLKAHTATVDFMKNPANLDKVTAILAEQLSGVEPKLVRELVKLNVGYYGYNYDCEAHDNVVAFQDSSNLLARADAPSCKDFVWGESRELVKNLR